MSLSNQHIYLDTRQSTYLSNGNPADSNFVLPQLLNNEVDFYQVCLNQMSFPHCIPCFQTGKNTTFIFRENSGVVDFSFDIDQGSYDGISLATHIQSKMNAVVGKANTYSVSYNSNTKKLTIYTTIPNTFQIRGNSTCLYELGFQQNTNTTFLTTHTSISVVNLAGLRYIDVVANFNCQSYSSNSKDILARIYMENPFGSIIMFRRYIDMDYVVASRDELQSMNIQLYDDKSQLINLPSNQYITYDLSLKQI